MMHKQPMRVVVAMDSFKGSVTSTEAGNAVARGVLAARADADVTVLDVADGGEGTVAALASVPGVQTLTCAVRDMRGALRDIPYVLWGETVIVESASVLGLPLLAHDEHGVVDPTSPEIATSLPLGQLMRAVIKEHAPRTVMVGLGGTGTTDGGTGMLAGLGGLVRDADGHAIDPADGNPLLRNAASVELPDLGGVTVQGLTDVRAPLRGPAGAARMFGPQKGAQAAMVEQLEAAMAVWEAALPAGVGETPGAGAAGGLGAAVLALSGHLTSGSEWVLENAGAHVWADADVVFTGEGHIDEQSAWGKVPHGVGVVARRHGAPVIVALGGAVGTESLDGIDAVLPIHQRPLPLAEAMNPAVTEQALTRLARQVTALVATAHAR
ncbi:glycerate kinase family protein [Demequina sediminicola]|uniref:glycerate kinase family protein n=1 Tax=Demequina sediminicola TaxID=1095026 RepID=UPI0007813F70|nr:glycerate kinase [Demequina sediminicola]